jgi:hypothetical protein
MRDTRVFYPGGNTVDGEITYYGQMFILYAAIYLCNRHAPVRQLAPSGGYRLSEGRWVHDE